MTVDTYNHLTVLLDVMEKELDKIAAEVGHISFKEFMEIKLKNK